MRASMPVHLSERRLMVLRKASAALRGRPVTLWRGVKGGGVVAEAASSPIIPKEEANRDVAGTLEAWGLTPGAGSLWIACRGDGPAWYIAPVRDEVPAPSPTGVERRSADRLTLELAGLVLGALERAGATADQATVYLCAASAVLDSCLDRVRSSDGLPTAVRARLLADLAGVADAIEDALEAA
jgi:hypothetical protein